VSGENVEVVRRAYEALARFAEEMRAGLPLDDEALAGIFDPDVVLVEVADYPDADSYPGYEGLRRWLRAFLEIYDETEIVPGEPVAVGNDTVIVPTHQRFKSKMGVSLEQDITHVWRFRKGRVVYTTGYRDHGKALEAVGLRE
jgi:ketosteroid isomerase-like protein